MVASTRQKRQPFLFATLAGTILLLSIDLLLPFNRDNEIFQSMAMDLVRFGRLPYLGSWAHDFPGTIYAHWLSITIFGNSELGFRLFDLSLHLAMAWMFYSLVCRWLAPRTALLAVMLYMLHYISDGFVLAGQRDEFALFFMLLGTVLILETTGEQRWKYLTGFGAGIALTMMFTFRATYGTFPLVGLAFLQFSIRNKAALSISFMMGSACVLLALFIPYFLQTGGMEQVYLATIRYNLDIYGGIRSPVSVLTHTLLAQKLFLVSGLLGILFLLIPSLRRLAQGRNIWGDIPTLTIQHRVLFTGYTFCGLISLLVMGKYMIYHFEPLILILAPFAAVGLESLLYAIPGRIMKVAMIAVLVVYSGLRVYPIFLVQPFVHDLMIGQPIAIAQNEIIPEPGFRRDVDAEVASYIERTAPSGERIECATLSAGIRWRSARMCVTRYTTFYALTMRTPGGHYTPFQIDWRKAYIDSLRSAKPYYIVIGNGPDEIMDWVHEPPTKSIHEIPGFDSMIVPHYRIDTAIGGYDILKRRD